MGTLRQANSEMQEHVTEILDESRWPDVLDAIIGVLRSKNVQEVKIEFGFVVDRELRGELQPRDSIVPLDSLRRLIAKGLEDGTIEWAGTSDFIFSPVGSDLTFMLCNDADLHFASRNPELLRAVSDALISLGVKVYLDGEVIHIRNI